MKKVAKNAAIAYGGYKVHDYLDQETQIIVRPEINVPSQEHGISLTEVVIVLISVVIIALLAVVIKYIVKGLVKKNKSGKNNTNNNFIPMYQCNHTNSMMKPTAPPRDARVEVEREC